MYKGPCEHGIYDTKSYVIRYKSYVMIIKCGAKYTYDKRCDVICKSYVKILNVMISM